DEHRVALSASLAPEWIGHQHGLQCEYAERPRPKPYERIRYHENRAANLHHNHRRGNQRCGPESEASHFSDGVSPAKQLLKAGNPTGGGEAHPRAINHSEDD